MINTFSEQIEFEYDDTKQLSEWIEQCSKMHNKELGDINIIFCSDDYLYEMNKIYLNHDYYTDVITFPYNIGNKIEGDIFISIDRVKDNAKTYNTSFENELNRVIIHGVLHLIGFKDKSEEEQKEMRKQEDTCLEKLKEK